MSRSWVSQQQSAFFTQNGYIELSGIPFDQKKTFESVQSSFQRNPLGRDLWREEELLQQLLLHKLASINTMLVGKSIRLGCDQWLPLPSLPPAPCPTKDLICLQGLALILIFSFNRNTETENESRLRPRFAAGIPPCPNNAQNILFVKPHILLDWPMIKNQDLYLVAYTFANAGVYIRNTKDPGMNFLKKCGYEFGDSLQEKFHPLLKKF